MTDHQDTNALEAARTRLEAAMSKLAQGAAGARDARVKLMDLASEKEALSGRVASLEQENLKLHEQVATLSLQDSPASEAGDLATVLEEKTAIEQNYALLKRQYAALQDEIEAMRAAQEADDHSHNDNAPSEAEAKLRGENAELKKAIMVLKSERDDIRSELDSAIEKLETLVESA